ncbi:unnamed protein product, partial [Laminaria digitata]
VSLALSLKWSFLAELASKSIAPIVFIILASLLTPEDFGVFTAAVMVVGFSQLFWDSGMGKALIQRQTDQDEAASIAFWVNLILGLVLASTFFLLSDVMAVVLFQDARVGPVLRIMTVHVLLGALASVPIALLQKAMRFRALFWIRLTSVTIPALASIPLAVFGYGYWALVAGVLVGQAIQLIILWSTCNWYPALAFEKNVAKDLMQFGAWAGSSSLLAWFYLWADALIVGQYLGTHDLGLYRVGNQFSMLFYTIAFGPVMPVLYSYLSKIAYDSQRIRAYIQIVVRAIAFVALPVAFMVFSFADEIEATIFGSELDGVGVVLGVLALSHGFSWLAG